MAILDMEKMQTDIQDIKKELHSLNPEKAADFDWLLENVDIRRGGVITDSEKVVKGWIVEYFGYDLSAIDTNRFSKRKELENVNINKAGVVYNADDEAIGTITCGFVKPDVFGNVTVINNYTSIHTLYDTDDKILGVKHEIGMVGFNTIEDFGQPLSGLTDTDDLPDEYQDSIFKSCRITDTGAILDLDTMTEIGKLNTNIFKNLDYESNAKVINHNILHKCKVRDGIIKYKSTDVGIVY